MDISIILSILGITVPCIVTIVIYMLQTSKKSLSYQILSLETVLTDYFFNDNNERLSVSINGNEVANPMILKVKITNDGKTPITGSDFAEQEFGISCPNSSIIGYSIVETSPVNLKIEDRLDGFQEGFLYIKPLLLNKGDFIIYKLLVDNFDKDKFSIIGRIVGVKEIREKSVKRPFDNPFIRMGYAIGLMVSFFSFIYLFNKVVSLFTKYSSIITFFAIIALMGTLNGFIGTKKERDYQMNI